MAADPPFADEEEPDERLRPAWEDIPDETDADLVTRRRATSGLEASDSFAGAEQHLSQLVPFQ